MSYFPTHDEISSLGFLQAVDENGDELIYLERGSGCTLTLENDEGWAVVMEWLPDGIHAWVTCGSFADLQFAVDKAFEVLAEGRSKDPQLF